MWADSLCAEWTPSYSKEDPFPVMISLQRKNGERERERKHARKWSEKVLFSLRARGHRLLVGKDVVFFVLSCGRFTLQEGFIPEFALMMEKRRKRLGKIAGWRPAATWAGQGGASRGTFFFRFLTRALIADGMNRGRRRWQQEKDDELFLFHSLGMALWCTGDLSRIHRLWGRKEKDRTMRSKKKRKNERKQENTKQQRTYTMVVHIIKKQKR